VAIAVLMLSCGCAKEQAISATATAAAAVAAAAVYRAATDECWGNCSHGYVCNHRTGACVLPEELDDDPTVAPEGSRDDSGCVQEDDGREVCPDDPPAGTAPASADACRDLCLGNETCVLDGGVADCVAR
jgi:hypothetical protein